MVCILLLIRSTVHWGGKADACWIFTLLKGRSASEVPNGACPPASYGVTKAAWHEPTRFDWNKAQRPHVGGSAACGARVGRLAHSVEQSGRAYGLYTAHS